MVVAPCFDVRVGQEEDGEDDGDDVPAGEDESGVSFPLSLNAFVLPSSTLDVFDSCTFSFHCRFSICSFSICSFLFDQAAPTTLT